MNQRIKIGIGSAIGITILILLYMFVGPEYTIWSEARAGEANLAHARYSRMVKVVESQATVESSSNLAHAEVVAARGVDSAIRIIGSGLNENANYIRYLYVKELKETQNQVIYLPTEAGLPILEANRLSKPAPSTP